MYEFFISLSRCCDTSQIFHLDEFGEKLEVGAPSELGVNYFYYRSAEPPKIVNKIRKWWWYDAYQELQLLEEVSISGE